MQILIAEDNPVNQMVAGMIMKKLGYVADCSQLINASRACTKIRICEN